jgi:preprotein translocase subunit SecF
MFDRRPSTKERGAMRWSLAVSLITLLLSIFFVATRGLNFAVEFSGGTIITVHSSHAIATESVEGALAKAEFADVQVQAFSGHPFDLFIILPPMQGAPSEQLA